MKSSMNVKNSIKFHIDIFIHFVVFKSFLLFCNFDKILRGHNFRKVVCLKNVPSLLISLIFFVQRATLKFMHNNNGKHNKFFETDELKILSSENIYLLLIVSSIHSVEFKCIMIDCQLICT